MFFKLKRFLPFILAGILGVAAVVMMQRYVIGQRKALAALQRKLLADYENPVEIVVARSDIKEGDVVTPAHLERASVPPRFIQPYATPKAADLVGKVARVPIAKGEQVMSNKLALPEAVTAKTLAGLTPTGKRALTIGTDVLTAVGGFIEPGDQVDVLWTFQAPSPTGKGTELLTMTLFQDVLVLAIDQEMVGQEEAGKGGGGKAASIATIALTPQETQLLLFAREQGQIALSLRSDLEKAGILSLPPANLKTVMELLFGAPPVEEKPAPPPQTVEVFKGLERNVVTVNQ